MNEVNEWPTTTVTTTYLHLPTRAHFRPALAAGPELLVLESREPLVAFYRFLYAAVGEAYSWVDRLSWTDAEVAAFLARPTTTLLVLYLRGTPAGYIELDATGGSEGDGVDGGLPVEVAYFGIMPPFQGRGLGKHLLSAGVQRAYDDGAARIWLHTCTLDGPHALANYQARGFVPYKTTLDVQHVRPGTRGKDGARHQG